MPSHPHDALFHTVFSDPENVAGELQALLPAALCEQLDWSTLRREPGSFIDEELRGKHTDLLFSVALRTDPTRRAFLYVLAEHQSAPDEFMPLRLLAYEVRIWEAFRKNEPKAKRLPAILPVVLHHGEHGWTAATQFAELLDLDPESLAFLADFLPNFRFLLDDLHYVSDATLRARIGATAYARLTLFFLKHARDIDSILGEAQAWHPVFEELSRTRPGTDAPRAFIEYYIRVAGERADTLRQMTRALMGPDIEEKMMTFLEQCDAELRAEGTANAVLTVLIARGISVANDIRERILACRDVTLLNQWLTRAITASSADEVFTG